MKKINFTDDTVKYRKKAIKTTVKKSNHKHEYVQCICIEDDNENWVTVVKQCSVCGHLLRSKKLLCSSIELDSSSRKWCHTLEDVAKLFPNLKVIHI